MIQATICSTCRWTLAFLSEFKNSLEKWKLGTYSWFYRAEPRSWCKITSYALWWCCRSSLVLMSAWCIHINVLSNALKKWPWVLCRPLTTGKPPSRFWTLPEGFGAGLKGKTSSGPSSFRSLKSFFLRTFCLCQDANFKVDKQTIIWWGKCNAQPFELQP